MMMLLLVPRARVVSPALPGWRSARFPSAGAESGAGDIVGWRTAGCGVSVCFDSEGHLNYVGKTSVMDFVWENLNL